MLSLEHLIQHYMKFADGLPTKLRYPVAPKPKPPLPPILTQHPALPVKSSVQKTLTSAITRSKSDHSLLGEGSSAFEMNRRQLFANDATALALKLPLQMEQPNRSFLSDDLMNQVGLPSPTLSVNSLTPLIDSTETKPTKSFPSNLLNLKLPKWGSGSKSKLIDDTIDNASSRMQTNDQILESFTSQEATFFTDDLLYKVPSGIPLHRIEETRSTQSSAATWPLPTQSDANQNESHPNIVDKKNNIQISRDTHDKDDSMGDYSFC